MHLSFKSICNKEHKGVICNMTSSNNSSQITRPTGRVFGKNYSSFLDFTCNYERTSGIFVPCMGPNVLSCLWMKSEGFSFGLSIMSVLLSVLPKLKMR